MTDTKQKQAIFGKIEELLAADTEKTVLIAVDGKSGSGKSTLAGEIQKAFGGNVFHMDDFFLRPGQRTEERLSEIGGNVDYERFRKVLQQIATGGAVDYQAYDCKTQCLRETVSIRHERLNIVEGSYSLHPFFGDIYDLKIVLDIDGKIQRERIGKRNGEVMLRRFEEEWIPKENAYLEAFHIYREADILWKTVP